jgi:ABC-type uncharacterized transport system auxiliary subunit
MKRLLLICIIGCGGRAPETHYYDLAAAARRAPAAGPVLAIEPLEVDDAYDDERIVYRENPYRLAYYHYHRWSATPGILVAGHLERALEASGHFSAVVRGDSARAALVLGGRVVALEEVDVSKKRWMGRVSLELFLRDAASGEIVWIEQFDESEPLRKQSPEGLARGISRALDRIARRAAPELAARVGAKTVAGTR